MGPHVLIQFLYSPSILRHTSGKGSDAVDERQAVRDRRTPYEGFWAVISAFGVTQLVWVLAPVALVILAAVTGA